MASVENKRAPKPKGNITMSNNIDNIVGVENSNPKSESHVQHQQTGRLVNASDNVAVNKSTLPKKANKVNKVVRKVKVSRVIQLEHALGRQLRMIDLLRHFTRAEIDAEVDWLYPGFDKDEPELIEVMV